MRSTDAIRPGRYRSLAKVTHGPGLRAADGVELVGVWGRNADKASQLATELGVTGYDDYAELLEVVDALAFAVPPRIQASMALEAAAVASICCLTSRSRIRLTMPGRWPTRQPMRESLRWCSSPAGSRRRSGPTSPRSRRPAAGAEGGAGCWRHWMPPATRTPRRPGAASSEAPSGTSAARPLQPGRHARPDRVPPSSRRRRRPGPPGHHPRVRRHQHRQLSLSAPPTHQLRNRPLGRFRHHPPPTPHHSGLGVLTRAATELVESAESGDSHPVDVAFGTRIVELLATAEHQLST